MKIGIFAIRDSALGTFMPPYFYGSDGAAIRAFGDAVGREAPDNLFHAHPEHFSIYRLGSFDDETGLITAHEPQYIVDGPGLLHSQALS